MENISRYHRYLFLGKITNTLTDTEKLELDTLFSENKEAQEQYLHLVSNLPSEDVADSFKRADGPGFWRDLPGEAFAKQKRLKRIVWLRRAAIAAVSIGILFFTWSIWTEKSTQDSKDNKIVAAKEDPSIKLTLANGKVIDLTKQKGQISEQDISIINEEKALSYENISDKVNGMNSVEVPVGMDYQINLSDGSTVWMNSKTKLQFPSRFSGGRREITISGEAYLKVAKDSKQPFIVYLPHGSVQVLGTEFNVNSYEREVTKVALIEGRVKLKIDSGSIAIQPGIQVVHNNITGSTNEERFEAKKVLSWRKGIFYFEKTSLNEISPVLERWFGIKTTIDNPALLNKRFTGILDKNKPIESFLDHLSTISKISTFIDKDGVAHFK